MNLRRFAIGTLVGGITVFVIGIATFSFAPLIGFFDYAMNAGAAVGVARSPQLLWAVALASLSYGALVTLAIVDRPRASSVGAGLVTGAIVGFLLWFTADFMLYGVSNVGNLTSTAVGPLIELVPGAAAGGVIAAVVGKVRS
jgi:hypothetical protein